MVKSRNTSISERQLQMIEMRAAGKNYTEIGEAFQITGSGARENIRYSAHLLSRYGEEALPDGVKSRFSVEELIASVPSFFTPNNQVQKQEEMIYRIKITQTLEGFVDVRACSPSDARKQVEDFYITQGRELPDMDDTQPLRFSLVGTFELDHGCEKKPSLTSQIHTAEAKSSAEGDIGENMMQLPLR